jgi:hypothetical protein
VIARNVGIAAATQVCQNIRHGASGAGPRRRQAFKQLSFRMLRGCRGIAEIKEFLGCARWMCSLVRVGEVGQQDLAAQSMTWFPLVEAD